MYCMCEAVDGRDIDNPSILLLDKGSLSAADCGRIETRTTFEERSLNGLGRCFSLVPSALFRSSPDSNVLAHAEGS